jgi:hypothetical protein
MSDIVASCYVGVGVGEGGPEGVVDGVGVGTGAGPTVTVEPLAPE